MRTYQTEVRFEEWPLIVEFPRLREWGLLDIVVTVEHDGRSPEFWDIVEIEFEPAIAAQAANDRHPVPAALRDLIEAEIRGRDTDRDRIRVAISESLPVEVA